MTDNPSPQAVEIDQWFSVNGREMLTRLGITPGQTVMDFGCGPGRYTVPLSQVVGDTGQVVAIDRQEEPLAELRERLQKNGRPGSVRIKLTNGDELGVFKNFADDSVDAALLFDVLQHVTDWQALFDLLARVIKTGGRLLVYPAAVPHPGSVDSDRVTQMLTECGFKAIGSQSSRMIHNVEMVTDTVFSFQREPHNRRNC
jgi:ubiquinone/menaquinone biosynthesis C-methylase UbiE